MNHFMISLHTRSVMHKQVSVQTVNVSQFSREPLSEIALDSPHPP